MQTIGSRAQVWHGTAKKTSGGLTKTHLMMNKHGRIVSKKKHASGKKTIKNLKKLGYVAKKGHFKLFHKLKRSKKMRGGYGNFNDGNALEQYFAHLDTYGGGGPYGGRIVSKKKHASRKLKRSKKMRGGGPYGGPLSPHSYDGEGEGTSGVGLQFVAGNAAA